MSETHCRHGRKWYRCCDPEANVSPTTPRCLTCDSPDPARLGRADRPAIKTFYCGDRFHKTQSACPTCGSTDPKVRKYVDQPETIPHIGPTTIQRECDNADFHYRPSEVKMALIADHPYERELEESPEPSRQEPVKCICTVDGFAFYDPSCPVHCSQSNLAITPKRPWEAVDPEKALNELRALLLASFSTNPARLYQMNLAVGRLARAAFYAGRIEKRMQTDDEPKWLPVKETE